jgi:diguanylate cyclase (GGDEF)-like protein/PAS domain S-box-containing protein
LEIVDPQDRALWETALAERGRTGRVERRSSLLRGDGSTITAHVVAGSFTDASGEARCCVFLTDLTEREAAEETLVPSEQRFRRLIETTNEAFIAMNAEGRITDWNRQAEVIFGWTVEEAVGRLLAETVIPPRYREAHTAGLNRFLTTGAGVVLGQRLQLDGRRKDGSEFPVELTIWTLDDGPEVQFNALLHDISERRRLEGELWELALVDELTGLHNRRSFNLLAEQALKAAVRAKRPAIALFADVDRLKEINDTYGHAEGDRALQLVAGALKRACRESDIVGRLGGDEFAVILTEAQVMASVEARVRECLAELVKTLSYPLTVSLGLVTCEPDEDCQLRELLARADQIMYSEKAAKRRNHPAETP